MIPLLILANPAIGQLDSDFSPRSFNGSPLVASVQVDARKPGGPSIFRNYRFDSQGTLRTIEQGSDTLGVTLEVTFESDSEGRPVKASAVFMGNLGWTEGYSYDEKGRLETWVKSNPRTGVETVSERHIYDEAGRQVVRTFTDVDDQGKLLSAGSETIAWDDKSGVPAKSLSGLDAGRPWSASGKLVGFDDSKTVFSSEESGGGETYELLTTIERLGENR